MMAGESETPVSSLAEVEMDINALQRLLHCSAKGMTCFPNKKIECNVCYYATASSSSTYTHSQQLKFKASPEIN